MGRIGKVIKSFIGKLSGSSTNAQIGSVEEFAGDERTTQYLGPCNEDFAPPTNCKTFNVKLGRGRGFLVSLSYHNQQIEPVAIHGERRIYSTNKAGDTVKAEVFLKQDGAVDIKNDNAEILIDPAGKITIKNDGVEIIATNAGLLTIKTDSNTEITSAKTIINNDIDIIGNTNITGILTAGSFGGDINVTSGVIKGANVFNGPDSNIHGHEQGNDSGPDTEVKTDAPS